MPNRDNFSKQIQKLLTVYPEEILAVRLSASLRTIQRWRDGTIPRTRYYRKKVLQMLERLEKREKEQKDRQLG